MIKECKVVLHNQYVTVVECDGINIQFPSIGEKSEVVYVRCKKNDYSIVSKNEYEKFKQTNKIAQKNKVVEPNGNADENVK